jgi:hypothetical protein
MATTAKIGRGNGWGVQYGMTLLEKALIAWTAVGWLAVCLLLLGGVLD